MYKYVLTCNYSVWIANQFVQWRGTCNSLFPVDHILWQATPNCTERFLKHEEIINDWSFCGVRYSCGLPKAYKLTHRQTSNISLIRQYNCWSLRCNWSIACRRCSNYIIILDWSPGFNGLRKDNCKARRESFKLHGIGWWKKCRYSTILPSSD